MRRLILIVSASGALLFGGAFFLSWSNPLLVERAGRELLRIEVEHEVGQRIDELSDSRIAGFAQKALRKVGVDVDRAQADLRTQVPQRVANAVADMLDADCTCRQRLLAAEDAARDRLASLQGVQERLAGLIESAYASVRANLLREFRIFTGSNAVAFALLGAITLLRKKASLQLALPALVLVGAVAITGGLYLFNQDWLHTIVFGEYVGFGYSVYLAGVAALLSDIAFNRARITTGILEMFGASVQALPC